MLHRVLSSIDIFGTPIILNFAKANQIKSSFGGFWSLVFVAFFIWSVYNSGYELIAKERPQVIDGSTYSENLLTSQTLQSIPLAFGVFVPYQGADSKFCTYRLGIPPDASADMTNIANSTQYELEKCTPEYFNEYPLGSFESHLPNLYCLPRNLKSSTAFKMFYVAVICDEQDEGEDFLAKRPYSQIVFPNYGLTLQNYSHPVQKSLTSDLTFLKDGIITTPYWSLSYNSITTNDGWLFTGEKLEQHIEIAYKDVKETELDVIDGQKSGVILYVFQASNKGVSYARSYKSVQTFFAEVGGTASIALTVLAMIVTPYARIKFSETFVNELFDIENKKFHKLPAIKRLGYKKDLDQPVNNIKTWAKMVPNIEMARSENFLTLKKSLKNNRKLPNVEESRSIKDKKQRLYSSLKLPKNKNTNHSPQHSDGESILSRQKQEKKQYSIPKVEINASSLQVLKLPQKDMYPEAMQFGSPIHSQTSVLHSPECSHQKAVGLDDVVNEWENNLANLGNASLEIKQREQDLEAQHGLSESKIISRPIHVEVNDNEQQFIQEQAKMKDHNKENAKAKKGADEDKDKKDKNKLRNRLGTLGILEMSLLKKKKMKRQKVINISVFEYVRSFIWKSASLKEKMSILDDGLVAIDNILNIFVMLKKIRDIDKIKSLLFDEDQLFLFEQLSPSPVMDKENQKY